MSHDVDDLLARVIDPEAALEQLRDFVFGDDDRPRTMRAAALIHLDCGHVRPMNVRLDQGDDLRCLVCGPARVDRVELIETAEFPHPDALRDLPETVA